jgi:hypothetical protein
MNCTCADWKPNIDIINGPFVLQQIRQPGSVRLCKPFAFCPWCGQKLQGEPPAEVPVRPRPEPETNKCRTCGKPTFGLYCAEHSPFKSRV